MKKRFINMINDIERLGYPVCTLVLVGGSAIFCIGVAFGAWL